MEQDTQIEKSATLAERLGISESQATSLQNSIFPGAKDESIELAWHYCKARKLDIMKKPCHIVAMSVADKWRDVIMPAIAEARTTAMRTRKYMGQSAPEFGPFVEMDFGKTKHTVPEFCKITVYRLENGEKVPFPNIEYFEEACGLKKDGQLNSMWTRRKRGQLAKCAEAGALRKAFPEELGGEIMAEESVGVNTDGMKQAEPAKMEPKSLPNRGAAPTPDLITPLDPIKASTLDATVRAWKAVGRKDADVPAACKYAGCECNTFEDLTQVGGEKLLRRLQKEMNDQAGKTQGQIKKEKAAKAAKQGELI